MAATRVVDTRLFTVEAGLIDWLDEARRRKLDIKPGGPRVVVALRWHVNGAAGNLLGGKDRGIGLPTGPFTVWRRPSFASQALQPVGFATTFTFGLNGRLLLFDQPVAMARLEISSANGGPVYGLASAPDPNSTVTTSFPPGGQTQVELHAAYLNGALIPWDMTVASIVGVPVAKYEALPGWQPVEIVGLPVDVASWAGVGNHAAPQGLLPALVDPKQAAVARIVRGTPPFGWDATVAAGVSAPPWSPPNPVKLVDEVNKDVVPALRKVLSVVQSNQAALNVPVSVPPPATLDGHQMAGPSSTAQVSPMMLLRLAVATDPFLSLALGYGTNLAELTTADVKRFHDGSTWDYMVTAPYAKGLTGSSPPAELVAYAPRPTRALPPFPPAQLSSELRAHLAPSLRDTSWGASSIVRWSRPPENAAVRVASYAAARHNPGAGAAGGLMDDRPSGGHRPIAPGLAAGDEEKNYVHLADRYFAIPNDPGHRSVRYSVATQSLFSLWSPWLGVDFFTSQPLTPAPRIVAATLAVTPPPLGKTCTGTLTVDFTWDWSDRSPETILLEGRMYASPDRATPPPVPFPPAGLQRAIGTSGPQVVLSFTGDTATVAGAPDHTLTYLNPGGDTAVGAGAAQGTGVRRYRLVIPGFTADFSATPHIGLALWSRGTEHLAPKHPTATAGPLLVYTSDPVAPPVPPEIVPLASLPDAEGRSHARISWPVAPGAAAYIVYTSDELTMLAHYGHPEPAAADTLSDRADALLDLWEANPDRRPFTRLTATPLTGTSLDVMLPKGSTAIHAYVVISTSAGQVEGPWPPASGDDVRDQVILRAAPRIANPAPPVLDASAHANGTVSLHVTTRAGHRVGRVDLYRVRVDDAARALDSMGPPIARVGLATPGWTVTSAGDGTPERFAGTDIPDGSWKRVWYRAVAWADDEWDTGQPFPYKIAERGLIAGRSAPSNPVAVVVPPAGPPDLSDLVFSWPGGAAADVRIDWTTLAPLELSPLGPHLLEVTVRALEGPATDPLVSYVGPLAGTPVAPPVSGDGLWRSNGGPAATFSAVVHRSGAGIALEAVVRIIDPVGRITQKSVRVPAGPLLPEPQLGTLDVVRLGADTALNFTSNAPAGLFNGIPYKLRITAQPVATGPQFPFPPPAAPETVLLRPGPLVPSPAEAEGIPAGAPPLSRAVAAAAPTATRQSVVPPEEVRPGVPAPGGRPLAGPRPLVLDIAIGAIPVDRGQPPGAEPLQIRRTRGTGRHLIYTALARVKVSAFSLRLTAPDGRVATASVEVPTK